MSGQQWDRTMAHMRHNVLIQEGRQGGVWLELCSRT